MGRQADGDDEPVDWLDLDEPEADAVGGPPRPRLPSWYLLVLGVVILLAVGLVVRTGGSNHRAQPSPRPSTSSSSLPTPASEPPTTSPPVTVAAVPSLPVTTDRHRALLAAPLDWELFARTNDAVVRIQLARGIVTTTPATPLDSSGDISFVVGPDRAIVRPSDNVTGYQVVDGRAMQALPPVMQVPGPFLPGPDNTRLWVPNQNGNKLALLDVTGRSAGPVLDAPSYAQPDGAGYPMFYDIDGTFDAGPQGVRRITTGSLLAAGPTGWLAGECDDQHRCATVFIDRATFSRRSVAINPRTIGPTGAISPDGTTAALTTENPSDGQGSVFLTLLDLATGVSHRTTLTVGFNGGGNVIWSPDGRYVFVVDDSGTISVVDRDGHVRTLDPALPSAVQLAFRSR